MSSGLNSPISHDSLADILERVLDKGVVVAGDVTVAIAGVELLTVKIRLLVTTVDKAVDMGIDWWRRDPALSHVMAPSSLAPEPSTQTDPQGRLAELETRLAELERSMEPAQ